MDASLLDPAVGRHRRQYTNSPSNSALANVEHTAERYRVGAPPLLLLPLYTIEVDTIEAEYLLLEELKEEFREVLSSNCVLVSELGFMHRKPFFPHPDARSDITVFIWARWAEPESFSVWPRCVSRLREILNQASLEHIAVEMLSWQLYLPKAMAPVERDHKILLAWENGLRNVAKQIVESSIQMHWSALSILRLGYGEVDKNPIVILVTVNWSLDPEDWQDAERAVRLFLDTNGYGNIGLLFERGDTKNFGAFEDLEPSIWSPLLRTPLEIKPGVSIGGTSALTDEAGQEVLGLNGTISLVLRATLDGELKGVVALTSYSTVRPYLAGWQAGEDLMKKNPDGVGQYYAGSSEILPSIIGTRRRLLPPKSNSDCEQIDKSLNGFNSSTKEHPVLQSPSRHEYETSIARHKDILYHFSREIHEYEENSNAFLKIVATAEEYSGHLRSLEESRDSYEPILGAAFLGSGLSCRTKDNERLDYALVWIDGERSHNNSIPTEGWPQGYHPYMKKISKAAKLDCPLISGTLFKVGADTGQTQGACSNARFAVKMPLETASSLDYAVIRKIYNSREVPFARSGDAGSAVFDSWGVWVGVIFGSTTVAQTKDVMVYMTPASAILEHFKMAMGNEDGEWSLEVLKSEDKQWSPEVTDSEDLSE